MPRLDDTIVAVSSAWEPSALGIVRLSGPQAGEIAATIVPDLVARPRKGRAEFFETMLFLGDESAAERLPVSTSGTEPGRYDDTCSSDAKSGRYDSACSSGTERGHYDGVRVSAMVYRFSSPHSYTGQDVIELHVPGSLPLLRHVCDVLIAGGARRALPGEFTARAFLNGRIDAAQVEGVLGLISAGSETAAREAARAARQSDAKRVAQLSDELADLLARVEAGIDFADEEDVQFITPSELLAAIDTIRTALTNNTRNAEFRAADLPHVALAGLPNAGKSTLFNCLLGQQRAIVSPVLGTTRDVLSAAIEIDGQSLILQDTAGLGESRAELDAAAHLAAETHHKHADLVLWVHDRSRSWTAAETTACAPVSSARRILVLSKCDRPAPPGSTSHEDLEFAHVVELCAVTGQGVAELRATIAAVLSQEGTEHETLDRQPAYEAVGAALRRAANLIGPGSTQLRAPDLVAMELRTAWQALAGLGQADVVEAVLGRIYTRFCVGK